METEHQHRAVRSEDRAFAGPVTYEAVGRYAQNPSAHGGICQYEYCRCGASRKTNLNYGHIERGRWID